MQYDSITKALDDLAPHATWEKVKQAWRARRHNEAVAMVKD
jgi:hypothetical protein